MTAENRRLICLYGDLSTPPEAIPEGGVAKGFNTRSPRRAGIFDLHPRQAGAGGICDISAFHALMSRDDDLLLDAGYSNCGSALSTGIINPAVGTTMAHGSGASSIYLPQFSILPLLDRADVVAFSAADGKRIHH